MQLHLELTKEESSLLDRALIYRTEFKNKHQLLRGWINNHLAKFVEQQEKINKKRLPTTKEILTPYKEYIQKGGRHVEPEVIREEVEGENALIEADIKVYRRTIKQFLKNQKRYKQMRERTSHPG